MRAFTIIVTVATIGTFDPALAQTTTPNVVTPTPGLQTPLTLHYDQLHDVLQFPSSELSNRLLRSPAAY